MQVGIAHQSAIKDDRCVKYWLVVGAISILVILNGVLIVLPVRSLNPGPPQIPGSPGYNATDPQSGWTFRFQPECLNNQSGKAALSYLSNGISTTVNLPWTFNSGCANAQARSLGTHGNGSIVAEGYNDLWMCIIMLVGWLAPFFVVTLIYWWEKDCCMNAVLDGDRLCIKIDKSRMFITFSIWWLVLSSCTLLGSEFYVQNVDDTTLCTPMLNVQFDGYGKMSSRDWSLVVSAKSGWYVLDLTAFFLKYIPDETAFF